MSLYNRAGGNVSRVCVSSVGEGAMHMKRPVDIGREAGIGRTRNMKELTKCRGARDDWPSAGWHLAGPSGPAPSKIIAVVVVVAVCCLLFVVCCLLLLVSLSLKTPTPHQECGRGRLLPT